MYCKTIILHLIQLCKRRYASALQPVEQAHGLTRNEIDVLLFLSNNPGYDTARDIVELRALSKPPVCKAVDSLPRRGFLAGEQDRHDRRCVHLTLQSAAGQAVQDAQQAQQDFVLQLYQGMTPEEEQALNRALSRLVKNLNDMEAHT